VGSRVFDASEKIHLRMLLGNLVGTRAEENHGSYLARASLPARSYPMGQIGKEQRFVTVSR
jgi:hypothetical protein